MILLDDKELALAKGEEDCLYVVKEWGECGECSGNCQSIAKTQAKKILIELQSIYKLPDLKMEHDRMGEFIKELEEEVNGNV